MKAREEQCLWQHRDQTHFSWTETFQVFNSSDKQTIQWLGRNFSESSWLYLSAI